MQLSSLGCEVDIAPTGTEALAMWKKNRYDLILADLNMPEMDGAALARVVREQEAGSSRHIPIICITAASARADLEKCLLAGMDDTLTKPISLEALRGILKRWAGGEAAPLLTPPAHSADASEDDPLDLDCLYRILGEVNVDQARRLVATFIESAGKGLGQLTSGKNNVQIAGEMHKQKSSARMVGALRYAKLAETLEQQARQDKIEDIAASLAALHEELARVSATIAKHQTASSMPESSPALARLGSLLIVDDDPVVLQQMSLMLTTLGVKEVLTAGNGLEALELLNERNGQLDALICDLNMPQMDGVELIRLFGRTGFRGGLVLMSGADDKVLSTVGKLADLQGLHVLGQAHKPVTPSQMVGLLSQASAPRVRKRQNTAATEVSAKSIRDGIERDEFVIWHQPTVDAGSLRSVGIETLARWKHPGRGLLTPDNFIGVAEREGLIRELSQVLVSKSLMEGAKLHEAGFPLTVAINLSGLWLDDLMLPDFILATTYAAKLRPSDVILEVTETGVMKDLTTALDVLTRLRLKGFGLSIDDFGIGYSSFEQLDRIPFTELKLDRSFVSKGAQDATARAILQSSMDMARKMALSTVAEGVETEADLELVRRIGCDRVQGYLIAKPMPTEALIAWLRSK
jgi:EAL domain-containing protein (putative c-di-GMP-specific phosphodiesterase class I)/DNA-binding response OmpR family regulator